MPRPLRTLTLALTLVGVTAGPAGALSGDLSGIGPTIEYYERAHYIAESRAHDLRVELAREKARPRSPKANPVRTGPTVSGTCAAMAPPGFPDYIIQRESRGDPNARNPSGAYGCAQIMPEHFSSGACQGLDYAACWARLWAGGAGASNWSTG